MEITKAKSIIFIAAMIIIFLISIYLVFPVIKFFSPLTKLSIKIRIIIQIFVYIIGTIIYNFKKINIAWIDLTSNWSRYNTKIIEKKNSMNIKNIFKILIFSSLIFLSSYILIYFCSPILKLLCVVLNLTINIIIIITIIISILKPFYSGSEGIQNQFLEIIENLKIIFSESFLFIQKLEYNPITTICTLMIIIIIIPLTLKSVIYPFLKFSFFVFQIITDIILIISLIIAGFIGYLNNYEKVNSKMNKYKRIIMIYINEIKEQIKDKIYTRIDPSLHKAKKLIKSCLSEEESSKFRKFANIFDDFGRKDFFRLFEGDINIDNDVYEIENLCKKYKIDDIEYFKLLILKFQNFQLIFLEWYEDITKHEYLKQIWKFNPTIYKLNDLDEEQLELKLQNINFSTWSKEDKNTLRQCIANSPEIKAIKLSNYIKYDLDGFNDFLENSMKYKNTLKKSADMKIYEENCYKTFKKLLKTVLNMKDKASDTVSKIENVINNRTLDHILKTYIKSGDAIESNDFYFSKIIENVKSEKLKNILKINNQLSIGISTAFSFFELTYQVMGLVECIGELMNYENEEFNSKLKMIDTNFKKHKDKIRYISENDEDNLIIIESILKDLIQDNNDIDELINNIEGEKKNEEDKKKKNLKKFAMSAFETGFGIFIGTALAGTLAPVVGGIAVAVGITKTMKKGVKVLVNIKKISYYKKILQDARVKQLEIKDEIIKIKNSMYNIIVSHCPEEMKSQIYIQYFSDLNLF